MGKLAVYRFFAGWIARIIRPIKVIGEKKLEKGQSIFCINHTSNWDAVAFVEAFKVEPMAMYKAELRENKFLRGFLDSINAIPVHRGEGDLNAIKTALTGLKNGKSLLIAPEATRNKNYDGSLLPFKVGAVSLSIKTKTPIRPVYIYHPRNKKGKIKGRTLIFVGEVLDLSQFYGQQQTKELLSQANERLFEEFCKLKESCQKYLADKKAKKSKR